MRYPKPRIASHVRYRLSHDFTGHPNATNLALQEGVCFSPPFPKPYFACQFYESEEDKHTEYYEELHQFEWNNFNRLNSISVLQQAGYDRYQRIKSCRHNFSSSEIDLIMNASLMYVLKEGEVAYSPATGKQLFEFSNGTLRRVMDWNKLVKKMATEYNITDIVPKLLTRRQIKNYQKNNHFR
jgi:hypothetical protein